MCHWHTQNYDNDDDVMNHNSFKATLFIVLFTLASSSSNKNKLMENGGQLYDKHVDEGYYSWYKNVMKNYLNTKNKLSYYDKP